MVKVYSHPVVQKVMLLHAELLSLYPGSLTVIDVLESQAKTLYCRFEAKNDDVCIQLSNWLPECTGLPAEQIFGRALTIHHMRLSVAREYGFASWEAALQGGDVQLEVDFERAVDAALNGNIKRLKELVDWRPELVKMRSQFGHRATILIYLAANGVETWRQIVPENATEIMRFLIGAGANPNATIQVYGGSHSMLELLLSSAHPRAAGILNAMLELLNDPR